MLSTKATMLVMILVSFMIGLGIFVKGMKKSKPLGENVVYSFIWVSFFYVLFMVIWSFVSCTSKTYNYIFN